MKHMSKLILLLTGLCVTVCTTGASAKTDVTGMWFTCLPNLANEQTHPFEVLRIKYVEQKIIWTLEWGIGNWANGRGYRENNGLQLRGCYYQGGKVTDACNALNPPIQMKLTQAFFTNPTKTLTDEAINNSTPVLTSAKTWEALVQACDALMTARKPAKELSAPQLTPLKAVLPGWTPTKDFSYRVNTAFPAYR
jgi:hypothetical protein